MTKSENKILDPERSHQIYLKIRDYSFSKLFEQMKKDDLLNGRLPDNFYKFYIKNIKGFWSSYSGYSDFLTFYFKNKWGK